MFLPLVGIRHEATAQHTAILTNLRHENLTNYTSLSCLTPPPFVNGELPQFFTSPPRNSKIRRTDGPTCRPNKKFYFVNFRALMSPFHIKNRLKHTYITHINLLTLGYNQLFRPTKSHLLGVEFIHFHSQINKMCSRM
jgi:hypothetical protein